MRALTITIWIAVHLVCDWGETSSDIKKGGIIQTDYNKSIIINRNSILITVLYDIKHLNYVWNSQIEQGESLQGIIGKNHCIEKIIADMKISRFKIKEFLVEHEQKNVQKRQIMGVMGLISGLTSLGLTTMELGQINGRINSLKSRLEHNEHNLVALNQITMYNTNILNQLKRESSHMNELVEQFKLQMLRDIDEINQVKIDLACVTLKLSYMKLSSIVHGAMTEIRDVINKKFNTNMLTYNVKKDICEELAKQGYHTYGVCTDFDLILETKKK